ncbi:sensor histidine kinase [Lactiplantibacillus herbarum]|uniref:sensor histidine kinase n=1 Tax=Lactiplantibacillus herbarum TaxID=1670446 RepID=UPI00064FBBE1|nr:GHKL domain-containing protein [Lactiplantibacillus herbarum]
MIDVSILDGFMQSFFIWLVIIAIYNYLLKEKNIKTMILSILLVVELAVVGTVIDDGMFLIVILCAMGKEKIKQGKLNLTHLNVLLALVISQMLVAVLTSYLAKLICYAYLNTDQISELSKVSHLLIGIQILMMYVVDVVILIIAHWIANKYALSIEKFRNMEIERHLFIMLLVLFLSIESVLIISGLQGVTGTIQLTLLITFALMIGLMGWQMIATINVYTRRKSLENEKLQNEQLSAYLQSVEQQYLELRKFKHDYKNLVVSLNAQNDISGIKDYLASATHSQILATSLDDVKIAQIQRLKNEAIRGLVVQKFFYANQCGVELNVEIPHTNFEISRDVTVVVRIIGNLLDNAIEQAQKMSNKIVTIAFNVIEDTLEIAVNNAIDSDFDQRKIFSTGYSTKGENRGLGLANVRELVDRKRHFYLDVEQKQATVTMTLMITMTEK